MSTAFCLGSARPTRQPPVLEQARLARNGKAIHLTKKLLSGFDRLVSRDGGTAPTKTPQRRRKFNDRRRSRCRGEAGKYVKAGRLSPSSALVRS